MFVFKRKYYHLLTSQKKNQRSNHNHIVDMIVISPISVIKIPWNLASHQWVPLELHSWETNEILHNYFGFMNSIPLPISPMLGKV